MKWRRAVAVLLAAVLSSSSFMVHASELTDTVAEGEQITVDEEEMEETEEEIVLENEEIVEEETDTAEESIESEDKIIEDILHTEEKAESTVEEDTVGDLIIPDTSDTSEEVLSEDEISEEVSGEEAEEETGIDERTAELVDIYTQWYESPIATYSASSDLDYATELAKFPSSYQSLLKKLHEKYPSWVFVAVDTGLDWDDVVAGESYGTRSLTSKVYPDILLSNTSDDYDTSTGEYVARDGSSWVNASDIAIAYYADPRNYLNEEYIFAMESQCYNEKVHTLAGVENVLSGTDLANKVISYTTTGGKTETIDLLTYGKAIRAAGAANDISPFVLAAKIKQETGAKLTNGSISGNYTYNSVSYRGYYNYYNIGAYATATGSAVANGLYYAMQSGSYQRPWTSPVLAIHGGAEFLANSYVAKGQNTGYLQRFNTVYKPYYQHQYMQNLSAAMSEAYTTYKSYKTYNTLGSAFVFYIPVYDDMPSRTNTVKISKTDTTATALYTVNMRKGPSTSYTTAVSVPQGATVKVSEIVFTDDSVTVTNKLSYPYWAKVTYGDYTGYICFKYLNPATNLTIGKGSTSKLALSKSTSGETIYYQTTDPAVATVDSSGKVTGVSEGICTIYAVTSSGRAMDMIGVKITAASTSSRPARPVLDGVTTVSSSKLKVTWKKVEDVDGYYIFRKKSGGSWSRIATVSNPNKLYYTNAYLDADTTYYYAVSSYKDGVRSYYSSTGISGKTAEAVYGTYKTTTSVNYRSKAGLSYAKKGTLSSGTKIQVDTGYERTVDGIQWYRFKLDGTIYYIASSYLEKVVVSLSTPTLSGVTNKYSGIKFTWKKVTGAEGYYIYRKVSDGSYSKIATVKSGSTLTYTDTTAKSGKTYTYTVKAYADIYTSKYKSAGLTIIRLAQPKISGLSIVSSSKLKLTWKKVDGAEGYYVYRKKQGGSWSRIKIVKNPDKLYFTNYYLNANTTYYYAVSAYADGVRSTYSGSGISGKTAAATYKTYKTTASVNYRNGAGVSFDKEGTLASGSKVSVETGYEKVVDGYTWYRVKIGTKTYYMISDYLKKM